MPPKKRQRAEDTQRSPSAMAAVGAAVAFPPAPFGAGAFLPAVALAASNESSAALLPEPSSFEAAAGVTAENRPTSPRTSPSAAPMNPYVTLNVGGMLFTTTLETLCKEPGSLVAREAARGFAGLARDRGGRPFIDRDGRAFRHILNFLRGYDVVLPSEDIALVAEDARYYELGGMVEALGLVPPRLARFVSGPGVSADCHTFGSSTVVAFCGDQPMVSGCHSVTFRIEKCDIVGIGLVPPAVVDQHRPFHREKGTACYISTGEVIVCDLGGISLRLQSHRFREGDVVSLQLSFQSPPLPPLLSPLSLPPTGAADGCLSRAATAAAAAAASAEPHPPSRSRAVAHAGASVSVAAARRTSAVQPQHQHHQQQQQGGATETAASGGPPLRHSSAEPLPAPPFPLFLSAGALQQQQPSPPQWTALGGGGGTHSVAPSPPPVQHTTTYPSDTAVASVDLMGRVIAPPLADAGTRGADHAAAAGAAAAAAFSDDTAPHRRRSGSSGSSSSSKEEDKKDRQSPAPASASAVFAVYKHGEGSPVLEQLLVGPLPPLRFAVFVEQASVVHILDSFCGPDAATLPMPLEVFGRQVAAGAIAGAGGAVMAPHHLPVMQATMPPFQVVGPGQPAATTVAPFAPQQAPVGVLHPAVATLGGVAPHQGLPLAALAPQPPLTAAPNNNNNNTPYVPPIPSWAHHLHQG